MTWTTRPRFEFGSLAAIRSAKSTEILFIHGVGLRAEAWNAQIDALSKAAATTAVDLPGHGESAGLTEPAKLADYTDAVAKGINEPLVVVGHSMGALIALDLAIRYPALIRAVVALNTVFQRSESASVAVQARAAELNGRSPTSPETTLTRWFGGAPSDERTACEQWLKAVDPKGYQMAYHVFAHTDGPDPKSVESMLCPAVFMTGREEPNSTPAMSKRLAQLAPNGSAEIVDGAAHMLPMTHPDLVSATLLRRMREVQQ